MTSISLCDSLDSPVAKHEIYLNINVNIIKCTNKAKQKANEDGSAEWTMRTHLWCAIGENDKIKVFGYSGCSGCRYPWYLRRPTWWYLPSPARFDLWKLTHSAACMPGVVLMREMSSRAYNRCVDTSAIDFQESGSVETSFTSLSLLRNIRKMDGN